MTRQGTAPLDLVLLPMGYVVWSIAFVALYGVQGLGCANGWHEVAAGPASLLRVLLIAIWLVSLAVVAALAAWTLRRAMREPGMMRRAVAATTATAAVAALWTGAPTVALALCN